MLFVHPLYVDWQPCDLRTPNPQQPLLKYLIERKSGEFTSDMISTGSTITANGWAALVDLYLGGKITVKYDNSGFVMKMKSIREAFSSNSNSLNKKHLFALLHWQEFLDLLPIDSEPCSPVWSMEFGREYKLSLLSDATSQPTIEEVCEPGGGPLPPYILSMFENDEWEPLPEWKKDFIKKNRAFYIKHKEYLSDWLKILRTYPGITDTLQKFEWQSEPSTWNHSIHELTSTFRRHKWIGEDMEIPIDLKDVKQTSEFILQQMGYEYPEDDVFNQLIKALDGEDLIPHPQPTIFLTKNQKKFRVRGIRILNRLLRKKMGQKARDMDGNVVQFRPSGVRISDSEIAPALVAIGQIPYLIENLKDERVYQLSPHQAAYLQGIDLLDDEFKQLRAMFSDDSRMTVTEQYMRLGNAVNVELVKRITYQLMSLAIDCQKKECA